MFESTVSNSCVTNALVKEFIYTWKIINFKYIHPGIGGFIETKDTKENEETSKNLISKISIYPDGYELDCKKYIGIAVHFNLDYIDREREIKYDGCNFVIGYFIDENNRELEIFSKIRNSDLKNEPLIFRAIKEKSFVFDERNGVLPNNNLTIKIKVYVTIEPPKSVNVIPSEIYNPTFEGFENLLKSEKFSDLKIIVDDDTVFKVHKGILAARSPVFAAMFDHRMKENIDSAVKVTDVDYRVMQEMLRFIYAGKVNDIDDIAGDLLVAADKYELDELKSMCEQILINNLQVDNVTNALILAENYSAPTLKKNALDFFKEHARKIVQNENYKADLNEISPLLLDIIKSLVL